MSERWAHFILFFKKQIRNPSSQTGTKFIYKKLVFVLLTGILLFGKPYSLDLNPPDRSESDPE